MFLAILESGWYCACGLVYPYVPFVMLMLTHFSRTSCRPYHADIVGSLTLGPHKSQLIPAMSMAEDICAIRMCHGMQQSLSRG